MVLRLDPSLPVLWRSPTGIQIGARDPVAVVDPLTPGQERLLAALESGVPEATFAHLATEAGVSAADAADLLQALRPALFDPPRATGIAVLGRGPLASALGAILDRAGALADGAQAGGAQAGGAQAGGGTPSLVALVADWVVAPPDHGAWLRRDIPHLPVVTLDRAVEVGPFVEPGDGPCLTCVHLARTDADPAWPAIATQLLDRPAPELSPVLLAEAAGFAARRLLERALHGPPLHGTGEAVTWRLDAATGGITTWRSAIHPECRCALPTGSGWARARDRGDHVWPRRATTVVSPG